MGVGQACRRKYFSATLHGPPANLFFLTSISIARCVFFLTSIGLLALTEIKPFFSQCEKPHRLGLVICVGEEPLKNPYF
jgi:hypothetical protein